MDLHPLGLVRERVQLGLPLQHLGQAFESAGTLLARPRAAGAAEIAACLARRDMRASTVLGGGLAFPHAEVARLRAPVAAYLRAQQPFEAAGQTVRDLLVLVVPKPATAANYALYRRWLGLLSEPHTQHQLQRCASAEALMRVLAGVEQCPDALVPP